MSLKSIRDLLVGPAHPSESTTLRDVAREEVQERTLEPDPTSNFTAKLPGDEGTHPLEKLGRNPFPGMSVLAISRAVREGKITDPVLRRKADAYIDQYQKLTGQAVYSGRNHEPDFPVEQQYADEDTVGYGPNQLRGRADPWGSRSR